MQATDLLSKWLERSARVQNAHYDAAAHLEYLHYWIGLPVVILSTLVGSSIFATLQDNPTFAIKFIAGMASVLTAILAGIQTFLRYGERAEKHRLAGVRYGAIKREIEQKSAFPPNDLDSFFHDLRIRWDQLNEESPSIPKRIWNRVASERNRSKSHKGTESKTS